MSLWGHVVHWTILEVTGEVELAALRITSTGILTLSFCEKGVPVENSIGTMLTFGETQRSMTQWVLVCVSHDYYGTPLPFGPFQHREVSWCRKHRQTYLKHIKTLPRWGPPGMKIHSPFPLSM